jgi:HEAT repeat protein
MPGKESIINDLLNQLASPDFFEREDAVRQLGGLQQEEAIAGLVMALEDEDRGIRELAAEHLIRIGGDTAAQLLTRFLGHADISVRNLAAELLVKIGREAVGALVDALDSPDHDIRKFALDILGPIREPATVGRVHDMLDDRNENVACSAAEALGLIGSSLSIEPLLQAFQAHEFLRPQAAEALGIIGDPAAFDGLCRQLTVADPVVLYSVIEGIGRLHHPGAIDILAPYLDHKEQMISDAATAAIIRTAHATGREAYRKLPAEKFKRFLIDGLSSSDPATVQFALAELRYWNDPEVIEHLVNLLQASEGDMAIKVADVIKSIGQPAYPILITTLQRAEDEDRTRLLEAVSQIADCGLATYLADLAQSTDADLRGLVATVLGKCGATEFLPILRSLTADPVGHVRVAAIKAIGWVGAQDEVDRLLPCLDDPFADVREAAMGALILLGGRKAIQIFTEDLSHINQERQRLAAVALGYIGEDETKEALMRAVSHSDPTVRRSAIESLRRIGTIDDIEPIRMALTDEDSLVRKAAVTALVALIGARAIDDIRVLLDDNDIWVRYHTIDTIGNLGDARFAPMIIPCLHDDQDIIKIAAVKALAAMGDQSAIQRIQELSTDSNSDLAAAVEEATKTLMENAHG